MTTFRTFRSINRIRVGIFTAAILATAQIATAMVVRHISLVSSSPSKDGHVMTPPKEIRLTFSGPVDVTKASVVMLGAGNKAISLDSLRAVVDSPRVAVAKVLGTVPAGNYTVKWTAVAADGADGSGSFGFMYMASNK